MVDVDWEDFVVTVAVVGLWSVLLLLALLIMFRLFALLSRSLALWMLCLSLDSSVDWSVVVVVVGVMCRLLCLTFVEEAAAVFVGCGV